MEGTVDEDGVLEEVTSVDSSVENTNTLVPISQTSSVAKAVADIQAALGGEARAGRVWYRENNAAAMWALLTEGGSAYSFDIMPREVAEPLQLLLEEQVRL